MKRVEGSTVSVDLFGTGKHGYKDGDKANGIPATIVSADVLNHIQEEISNVIELSGGSLDGGNFAQLYAAIAAMIAAAPAGLVLSDFTGSNQDLSANGYQEFPGGLIVQWGTLSHGSASGAVAISATFPVAFPSNTVYLGVSNFENPTDALFFSGNTLTTTGFSGSLYDVSVGPVTTGDAFYLAVGY